MLLLLSVDKDIAWQKASNINELDRKLNFAPVEQGSKNDNCDGVYQTISNAFWIRLDKDDLD